VCLFEFFGEFLELGVVGCFGLCVEYWWCVVVGGGFDVVCEFECVDFVVGCV